MDTSQVLLIADDLMLGSSVSGHAAALSLQFANVSIDDAPSACERASRVLLLVDLETAGLDVATLAKSLPQHALKTAVAYGPHVHVNRLNAATEAGFGTVVSRGQFSAQVGQMISQFAAEQVPE